MTEIVPGSPPRRQVSDGSRASIGHLAEVWGDVVDLRHLAGAVAIGAVVSLGLYAGSGWLLAGRVAAPEVGRSYAMLAGLFGCVIGGAICARAFPPKRIMTEDSGAGLDRTDRPPKEGAAPDRGAPSDLPAAVADEMRALGLSVSGQDPGASGTAAN